MMMILFWSTNEVFSFFIKINIILCGFYIRATTARPFDIELFVIKVHIIGKSHHAKLIIILDIFAYFAKKDDGNVEHATTTGPYINTKADRKNMTQRIYSHQSAGLKIALPPRPEQLELQSLKIRDDETKDIENNSEVKQRYSSKFRRKYRDSYIQ